MENPVIKTFTERYKKLYSFKQSKKEYLLRMSFDVTNLSVDYKCDHCIKLVAQKWYN